MSSTCACGTPFSVDHAMSCHKSGLPTLSYNETCDLVAELLREVCPNVLVEPRLQPDGEHFQPCTANREGERGVFTPLVLSTTGGMAKEYTVFKGLPTPLQREENSTTPK